MNLSGSSSLAVNTNPSGELVAASPTKQGLLGLTGFFSLPCTGVHPQAFATGVHVVSASKPVKNDPRTSFATIVSGISMSRCSTPPPLLNVTDHSLTASNVSPKIYGTAANVHLSPGAYQPYAVIPTPRPPYFQQMGGKVPVGVQHCLRSSAQSAPADEKSYLIPPRKDEIINLRRQSAPAAHVSPLVSAGHLLNVQSKAGGSSSTGLQRHNSHIGLANLSSGTSSPQPFQVVGVIQPPVQHVAPVGVPYHVVFSKSQQPPFGTTQVRGISTADFSHSVGTPPKEALEFLNIVDFMTAKGMCATNFQPGRISPFSQSVVPRPPVSLQPQVIAAMSEQQTCPFSSVQADTTLLVQQKV